MTLLLLLKPGTRVVAPVTAPVVTAPGSKRPTPPPRKTYLAGTATIALRAIQPNLVIVPHFKRGRIEFTQHGMSYSPELSPHNAPHRADDDELLADEEFRRLVEAAYLLTR